MLQRAASNACSWWWASHIRTKQSKWLEQSLSDMEEKVHSMKKLIEEEGDSFAKRAEMYYKRRPELIEAVEDTYKAFKALADRYDIVSKELQNANNTIATVFPEQVQFDMDSDDDASSAKPSRIIQNKNTNIPKVPKASLDGIKGFINTASKKLSSTKSTKPKPTPKPKKLTMTKEEALHEINKVNKEILALQTVKEFSKSSYENGLAKFLELESRIMEMQERVSKLQDEYEVESVIEDSEARTLMAEAALKSCKETLSTLQEKQQQSNREAKDEFSRIEEAREMLKSLRQDYAEEHIDDQKAHDKHAMKRERDRDVTDLMEELNDIDTFTSEKSSDTSSTAALTVSQLAEKIDQLVSKVVNLETAVSSQTVVINTLRNEGDDLHARIRSLQSEKESLIGDRPSMSNKIRELEDRVSKIEELNKSVESHNSKLEANFAHVCSSLDYLSERLSSVRPDEEGDDRKDEKPSKKKRGKKDGDNKSKKNKSTAKIDVQTQTPTPTPTHTNLEEIHQKDLLLTNLQEEKEMKDKDDTVSSSLQKAEIKDQQVDLSVQLASIAVQDEITKPVRRSVTFSVETTKERVSVPHTKDDTITQGEGVTVTDKEESEPSWQQMLLNGAEDRDKILLREYTTILRNYKDVKRKLTETEKRDRDIQFDITLQMRQLKQAITKRDQEINNLRQELSHLQGNKDVTTNETRSSSKPKPVHRRNKPRLESLQQSAKPEVEVEQVEVVVEEEEESESEGSEEEIKLILQSKPPQVSAVEERLRSEIDGILDENLDFWLRFSTAFHHVQKAKSEVEDLMEEIPKLRDKRRQEGCVSSELKSEVRPIYKHMREIQTELTVWLEQRVCLKDELKRRFTSLCRIQEEITKSLKEGAEEEEIRFSTHQAAKLQGEILNMKQENNKVREELQACLDHVSTLQLDIEKTLRQLNQEFSICSDQPQLQHNISRKVPLRAFIFGTKAKKQKSIFNFMHVNRKSQPLTTFG